MTKEELREHCEKQVRMCEEWARGNDREPSGKTYEEHKLVLDLIKSSEQQSRKVGKWIIDDKEQGRIWHCHCSNCKKDPQNCIGGTENWWLVRLPEYCPNCGAEMRGDDRC